MPTKVHSFKDVMISDAWWKLLMNWKRKAELKHFQILSFLHHKTKTTNNGNLKLCNFKNFTQEKFQVIKQFNFCKKKPAKSWKVWEKIKFWYIFDSFYPSLGFPKNGPIIMKLCQPLKCNILSTIIFGELVIF